MRDVHGFETVDDDDLDGVLVEDETGLEESMPETVVFEIGLSDAVELRLESRVAGSVSAQRVECDTQVPVIAVRFDQGTRNGGPA